MNNNPLSHGTAKPAELMPGICRNRRPEGMFAEINGKPRTKRDATRSTFIRLEINQRVFQITGCSAGRNPILGTDVARMKLPNDDYVKQFD